MSDFKTVSRDSDKHEPINYPCRLCGIPTVFQPIDYQPKPGFGTGIAGMVYVARREAHCRGICFDCLNGKRRTLGKIVAMVEEYGK